MKRIAHLSTILLLSTCFSHLSYQEFEKSYSLSQTSTEKGHPLTTHLSQTMQQSVTEGLKLLIEVDRGVIDGVKYFQTIMHPPLEAIEKANRIFLVGSGSSGRVAIDLAAKYGDKVHGIIAGGSSAMIRAKEGFEDSIASGREAMEIHSPTDSDVVILISASGSASFNVGAGHEAADSGAKVFYFYNSESIPERTANLFSRKSNPVIPLLVDIGPQAINGSTRLQGASIALACIATLLTDGKDYCEGMQEVLSQITKNIDAIAAFVKAETDIFSPPNNKLLSNEEEEGYVTFLSTANSIREVLIDATETSPTFCTSPIRRETDKSSRAEYRAYLLEEDNDIAWNKLIGKKTEGDDNFIIASGVRDKRGSCHNRPITGNNLVFGVTKINEADTVPHMFCTCNGTIILSTRKLAVEETERLFPLILVFENISPDPLLQTLLLKQTLNLISNGAMINMGKVHGNQMIDVRASNNKLIDRCMRLTQAIWNESHPEETLDRATLYNLILSIQEKKQEREAAGLYTASVVKIALLTLEGVNKRLIKRFWQPIGITQ
jgi:N-acetylmuramic acid 6-phosphate etherase